MKQRISDSQHSGPSGPSGPMGHSEQNGSKSDLLGLSGQGKLTPSMTFFDQINNLAEKNKAFFLSKSKDFNSILYFDDDDDYDEMLYGVLYCSPNPIKNNKNDTLRQRINQNYNTISTKKRMLLEHYFYQIYTLNESKSFKNVFSLLKDVYNFPTLHRCIFDDNTLKNIHKKGIKRFPIFSKFIKKVNVYNKYLSSSSNCFFSIEAAFAPVLANYFNINIIIIDMNNNNKTPKIASNNMCYQTKYPTIFIKYKNNKYAYLFDTIDNKKRRIFFNDTYKIPKYVNLKELKKKFS